MMVKPTDFDDRTHEELFPTPELAAKWFRLLREKRKEPSEDARERQFLFAHGWLRGLADAGLIPPGDLAELRGLLIAAKPK